MISIGIIGLGFVGGAVFDVLKEKGANVIGYDKYKDNGIGCLNNCLECDILFLCLPTLFNEEKKEYDKSSIEDICTRLALSSYKGLVVIKSTIEPQTCNKLSEEYGLQIIHNPEFLTARTAKEDFENQNHIVIGRTKLCTKEKFLLINRFYTEYFPDANISNCKSTESECMKIFCNSFYSVKIQFFNELYLLCNSIDTDYEVVKKLMLDNNWINPMHTQVPGSDGKLGFGGACFPKDTRALLEFMKKNNIYHDVLKSCVDENNKIR